MGLTEILIGVRTSSELLRFLLRQAQIANQDGTITDAQLEAVKREAQVTDAEWDHIAASARQRLQGD